MKNIGPGRAYRQNGMKEVFTKHTSDKQYVPVTVQICRIVTRIHMEPGQHIKVPQTTFGGERMKEFYQMSRTEAQKTINGSTQPLTNEQIKANQEKYGPTALTEEKKKSIPQIFLEQYKDFLVIILAVAAIVSGVLGEMESAIVILVVITMNAILGTVQTVKAEQSLDSLKAMSGPEAKILRNGDVIKIPSDQVTVGDIVMLEAGDYVPADGRILENASV